MTTAPSFCEACRSTEDSPNPHCQSCSSNCREYNSGTSCEICNQGFFLLSNGTCEGKPLHKSLNHSKGCLTGCSSCTSETSCQTCNQGYLLSDTGMCQDKSSSKRLLPIYCDYGCFDCEGEVCVSCIAGYFLEGYSCGGKSFHYISGSLFIKHVQLVVHPAVLNPYVQLAIMGIIYRALLCVKVNPIYI